jgi:hypothetical protein
MLSAQDEERKGRNIGDKLTMPMQIGKPTRRHNKPKKAQDYVIAPQGIKQILLFVHFATLLYSLFINIIASTVKNYACG